MRKTSSGLWLRGHQWHTFRKQANSMAASTSIIYACNLKSVTISQVTTMACKYESGTVFIQNVISCLAR